MVVFVGQYLHQRFVEGRWIVLEYALKLHHVADHGRIGTGNMFLSVAHIHCDAS
jgi:hypothetical protein